MDACQAERRRETQLAGLGYLKRLRPWLKRLRPVGCARDKAGNRRLFFDQYCSLVLLYVLNPLLPSLRSLVQASRLRRVQRRLGCRRVALGLFSEAAGVFDPEPLQEIAAELIRQIPPQSGEARLSHLRQALTAVDGSLLVALPQITQASFLQRRRGAAPDGWRLHAQLEILRGVPVKMTVTDARNQGPSNEKAVLRRNLEADRCYILDRGYEQFALFNAIVDRGSSYVCRVRQDRADHFHAEELRPLSPTARRDGVLEDAVGRLGSPKSRRIEHPHHRVRMVRVQVPVHPRRGGQRRPSARHTILLVTNRLDVPPEVIALIYRHRWMIELFFRFLKQVLGGRHLLSHRPEGIAIQVYCALIAYLLLVLLSGGPPTRRTYEIVCCHFLGWAAEEELLNHLLGLRALAP